MHTPSRIPLSNATPAGRHLNAERPSRVSVRRSFTIAMGALATTVLAACGSDGATEPAGPQNVSVQFAANVGSANFSCGQDYNGLGTTNATVSATDFMMFVSDVRLIDSNGGEVPITLTQDGVWQQENATLLDFASGGTGTNCPNATPETNGQVIGTVPAGSYTGLRFQLGLPFSMNHQDQASATGPLSLSRMFWSWNGGYKSLRLDLANSAFPAGWFIHLGSTGCTPTGSPSTVPTSCSQPNRITVTFNNFDVSSDQVVADIAELVSAANLDANAGGAVGCMSGPTDPECSPIFSAFGLPFGGGAASTQRLFRAVSQ